MSTEAKKLPILLEVAAVVFALWSNIFVTVTAQRWEVLVEVIVRFGWTVLIFHLLRKLFIYCYYFRK